MKAQLKNTYIDINEYVDRQPWSYTTKVTARAKLSKVFSISSIPEEVEKFFNDNGYSRYTIKQYFILAGGYNASFKSHFQNRRNLFKNAYKTKTREVQEADVSLLLTSAGVLYNAIYLMAFCGLRISEALTVKHKDVVKTNVLNIVGKGNKQRLVPCDMSKLMFPPILGPEDLLAGNSVSPTKLRKYLAKSGLTPHDLRAFFITKTTRSRKLDLDEVAVTVGHSSLNTTQRYLRSNIDEITRKLLG